MSGGNEGEENDLEEEFKFYFSFTKPLVLDLPTEEDRALAAAWVQKLETEPNTKGERQERLNYLKLLLFVLQRGRLSGIFARQPPSGPLQPFPQGFTVLDMGNLMMERDGDLMNGGGDAGHIPYTMELSNDMREYVASQEVPNFGVQMYYAWSSEEPVHKWLLFDENKFPHYILEKINQFKVIKRDEKTPKKSSDGFKISAPDLCSVNRVKSPEEIEKSQGRSFLTFMGLVGRNGNFNDKCEEDLVRNSRQPPQKKCPVKKKRCPGNTGADDAGEEDFDSFVSALGGEINPINRPCMCPNVSNQAGYSSQQPKKPPQSSCGENRMMGSAPDCENGQWNTQVPKSSGACRMREQYFDNNMPSVTPHLQRNSPPRSSPVNRRGLECPPEGNSGGFLNQGEVCVCTTPPCICPCPRAPPKSPSQKPPTPGGRLSQSPSRTYTRALRQEGPECNMNRNRGIGTHLTSFVAPEQCTPSPRPDMTPTGGRTNGGGGGTLRPVLHCYDNQNPDPALTRTIEKNDNWLPLEGGGAKYMDTDYKLAHVRNQLIEKAMENKCTLKSRRGLFNSPQPGPSGLNRMRPQTDYPQPPCGSPPLSSHPVCDYSSPGSNEDEVYPQAQFPQNFPEYQSGGPEVYPSCRTRANTSTLKKAKPQSSCHRNKNANQSGSLFTVANDSGRLANMNSVLQGLKQKTEAHREKYADTRTARPGEAGAFCLDGNLGQGQSKSFCRQAEPRARSPVYGGGSGFRPPPPSPQQYNTLHPNRVPGFGAFCNSVPNRNQAVYSPEPYEFTEYKDLPQQQKPQDVCDYEEDDEDDDECEESCGSLEEACENKVEDQIHTLSEGCKEALNRRPQDYYSLIWTDSEQQECRLPTNISKHNGSPYNVPSSSPEFIGTMMSENESYGPQWVSARGMQIPETPDGGTYSVIEEQRPVSSPRTISGRTTQRGGALNETQNDSCVLNETSRNNQPQGVRNRYFDRSLLAHAYPEQHHQPVCSTPLRHHREGFKGGEDLSSINR